MKFEAAEKYKLTSRSQIIGAINDYALMWQTIQNWDKRDSNEPYIANIDLATDSLIHRHGASNSYANKELKIFKRVNDAYIRFKESLKYALGIPDTPPLVNQLLLDDLEKNKQLDVED